MSYSFQVRGATKALALAAVAVELDKVLAQQPVHAADRAQAQTVAEQIVGVLPDSPEHDVLISVAGYVSGSDFGRAGQRISTCSCSVSAYLTTREPA